MTALLRELAKSNARAATFHVRLGQRHLAAAVRQWLASLLLEDVTVVSTWSGEAMRTNAPGGEA